MINIIFSLNILIAILFLIGILGLFFLRVIKSEVSREIDIPLVSMGLLYCLILILHGWRLDPILTFSQFLILIIFLYFSWENIRFRGVIESMEKKIKKYEDYLSDNS